ncbi:carbohydrate kinase family protein [soil metagenome]
MMPALGGVAVVGDVFCDIIVRGVARLPDWGEETFGLEPALCPGGVANVAVGLARLGVPTVLLGRTRANDTIGSVLATELAKQEHLEVEWLRTSPSTAITVALPHGGERAMISYVPPAEDRPLAPVVPWHGLDRVTHLHVGGWTEGRDALADQAAVLEGAHERGMTTSLDVSWQQEPDLAARLRDLLGHVDLFVPNLAEACWVAGTTDAEEALVRLARIVPTVVVKLGGGGAMARSGDLVERVHGHEIPVVDTTGAGDAFAAGYLHGHTRRWPLARSLALANACGALSVGRIGSSISVPTRREAFTALERGFETRLEPALEPALSGGHARMRKEA